MNTLKQNCGAYTKREERESDLFCLAFKWELENSREKMSIFQMKRKPVVKEVSVEDKRAIDGLALPEMPLPFQPPAHTLHKHVSCTRRTAHRSGVIEIQQAWIGVLFLYSIHHWNQPFHWARWRAKPFEAPSTGSWVHIIRPWWVGQSVFLSTRTFSEMSDSSLRQFLSRPFPHFFPSYNGCCYWNDVGGGLRRVNFPPILSLPFHCLITSNRLGKTSFGLRWRKSNSTRSYEIYFILATNTFKEKDIFIIIIIIIPWPTNDTSQQL